MATNAHADFFVLGNDDLLPRHRSEQNFTSAQFFAHALRHVISRPQATHNFVGSEALLPLKLIAKLRLRDCPFRPPLTQRREHVGQRAGWRDARNVTPDAANQLATDPDRSRGWDNRAQ